MEQLLNKYGLYYVAAMDCGEIGITTEVNRLKLTCFTWIYWWEHDEI